MGREEQIEEREVLDSIFPDEITHISETEFRLSITLNVPDEDKEEPPVILLTVRYPEDYPDKEPYLDLSAPQNAPQQHPHFNIADDKPELLDGLHETVQENLGMAMVFTLVSALKEAAEQMIVVRREATAKVHEEHLLAAEREENKKFHGTMVTPETFMKWREGFLKEIEEQEQKEEEQRLADLKKSKAKEPPRLSGRQLWETGMVDKVDEDAEDDDDVPADEIDKLQIEA